MQNRYWSFLRLPIVMVMIVMLTVGAAAAVFAAPDKAAEPEYKKFSDLAGKRVAMLTGAPFEEIIRSKEPNVGEMKYFSAIADMQMALKSDKIDAYFMNNAVGELMANRDKDLAIFPEDLGLTSFGFAFAKGDEDLEKWQKAFDTIPEEKKKELWDKWTGPDESKKTVPEQDWPGKNGTVNAAVCDTLEPMSYAGKDGKLIGFDIEMLLLIAKELDVHIEFTGMEFSSIMAQVQAGKAKVAAGSIVINNERRKAADFIEYYPAKFILIVRSASSGAAGGSFLDGLKASFERTFIHENRYLTILTGLGSTVAMTIVSGLLGILLGFALVFLRRKDIKPVNGMISAYGAIMAGVPAVVILMVIYYIVFGAFDMPSIIAAIVGFTMIFGARVFGTVWNAAYAVDGGQREAALALGYNEAQTFKKVVLPQAKSIYFPTLRSQLVLLLKETSVAGFIAVLDLTRAGDLIRSRTLEAFFPLIATAVIYFLLTWLLSKLIGQISVWDEKKRNERRIKGVD